MAKPMNVGLCETKNKIPGVDNYIYPEKMSSELLRDIDTLFDIAVEKLKSFGLENPADVDLYINGPSVGLITVLTAMDELGIACIVHHLDEETGEYYSQRLLFFNYHY